MHRADRPLIIDTESLNDLIEALRRDGYTVLGPVCRDGAILYDEIGGVSDLPAGWTDSQEAGTYQLRRRDDGAMFGYVVGPQSWKRFLFPPRQQLWRVERTENGIQTSGDHVDMPRYALLGVRSCELHAITVQDRVFLGESCKDEIYRARREQGFFVAVNCGEAGGTCFCVSMRTGPRADSGFDLALTELLGGGRHGFLVETGSERGAALMDRVQHREAGADDIAAAQMATKRAAQQMGRSLDTAGIAALLQSNLEHPRWDEVASRCLSCGNCTMVCPTCFCSSVEDTTTLDGRQAERWRRWDSCFTVDFSYLHGGSIRNSARSRYRQWMTHKLATWYDQFGTSGCVGCGRCITWCPVGIDLTHEAAAIRESDGEALDT